MKKDVRVGIVQFAAEWLDVSKNVERMASFVETAAQNGADLVVFPELSNLGYVSPGFPGAEFDHPTLTFEKFRQKYFSLAETMTGQTVSTMKEIAAATGIHIAFGMAESDANLPGRLFNSGVLVRPDGKVHVHRKVHLPLNEKHFFAVGNSIESWDTDLGKIGLAVCYDGRFPELARVLALQGAEIIVNMWAIFSGLSMTPGDLTLQHRAYTRAQENGLFYINCNRSGAQGPTTFVGRSAVAGPTGEILAFSDTHLEEVIYADLGRDDVLNYRASLSIYGDRRPELYSALTERW